MASIETSRPSGHECSKRPGTHQRMHPRHIVDAKVIRLIHDNYRELGSGLGESKNARPLAGSSMRTTKGAKSASAQTAN